MKKVYISPIIEVEDVEPEEILAGTVIYTGDAESTTAGGTGGNEDNDDTPKIEGTGENDDFILGSKNGFSWD